MLTKKLLFLMSCCLIVIATFNRVTVATEEKTASPSEEKVKQSDTDKKEHVYKLIEQRKLYETTSKETFIYYCSPCHGEAANGKGLYFTIDLKPSPRDLTDIAYMALLTDDYLKNFITQGSAAMKKSVLCPPWGNTLDETTIKGLISFLRGLTIEKSKEGADAAVKAESETVKVAATEGEGKETPKAVIWSVLIFLCTFFAVAAIREWKKLGIEEAAKK